MMLALAVSALLAGSLPNASAASCQTYWTINASEVRPGMEETAKRYFGMAWLPARKVALKRNLISDFKLLWSYSNGTGPKVQLVTVYRDKAQFDAREESFQKIFEELKTPLPLVVDGHPRADIFSSTVGLEDYREVSGRDGNCPSL